MINFNSLFNQFRSQSNGLADLLNNPNTPMSRVLDEDSFQNDYTSGTPKITQFMNYDKFAELVQFVTVVGPADDKKRSFKFKQFQIIQILSSNNALAIDFFFPDKPLTVDQKVVEDVEVEVEVQIEVEQPSEVDEKETNQVAQQPSHEDTIESEQVIGEKASSQAQTEDQVVSSPEQQLPPPTPCKKLIKVIQKQIKSVERTIKKQVQPLIGQLMSYFDGEVNYTLAGYVSKILTTFFNKKPVQFLKYVLQENVAEKVLNHAESRSVGDLIIKILVNETTVCLQQRIQFYKSILKRLSLSGQVFVLSNLSAYICEVIEKITANLKGVNRIAEFSETFFSLDVITQIINNVMSSDENISVYNAPILFAYLTNVPFVLPQEEKIVSDFKRLLEVFIDCSIEKLQISQDRPKLGTGRVKIIQIFRYILKENILSSKDIMAERNNFFPTLFSLIKKYDMNNMLHNQIIKIIEIALSENEDSPLNRSILRDNILLRFISEEVAEDQKIKTGTSIYKSRKGYIAHIINLCVKLKQLGQKNNAIKLLVDSQEFTSLYNNFAQRQIFNSKKSLAGYFVKKNVKYGIMFERDDIIASYAAFLDNCPTAVFEKEPEHINIEHPDLIEELQKQLDDNKTIQLIEQIATAQAASQPTTESHLQQTHPHAEMINPHNMFSVHMEFDIDTLLADL